MPRPGPVHPTPFAQASTVVSGSYTYADPARTRTQILPAEIFLNPVAEIWMTTTRVDNGRTETVMDFRAQ